MGRPVKAKWAQPFAPFALVVFPPPPDFVLRCVTVVGILFVVAVYMAISRPWEADQ